MSKTWFPDIIGPTKVGGDGNPAIGIRNKRLNLIGGGLSAVDNPSKRRTDLTIIPAEWNVITSSAALPGEWLPAFTPFGSASIVRVASSVTGTVLTGLDSGDDPTVYVKYIANFGTNTIEIDVPASPIAGKQYFASAYTLGVGATVRTVWDEVTRVYRLAAAVIGTDWIILDSDYPTLDGAHILNPQV